MHNVEIRLPNGTLMGGEVRVDGEPLALGISGLRLETNVHDANALILTLPGVFVSVEMEQVDILFEACLMGRESEMMCATGRTIALALSALAEKVPY